MGLGIVLGIPSSQSGIVAYIAENRRMSSRTENAVVGENIGWFVLRVALIMPEWS